MFKLLCSTSDFFKRVDSRFQNSNVWTPGNKAAVAVVNACPELQDTLRKNRKWISFLLLLNDSNSSNLAYGAVSRCIINGELTLEDALDLSTDQRSAICLFAESPELQQILIDNDRGLDFILSLRDFQYLNLGIPEVLFGIKNSELTLDDAIHLTSDQRQAIRDGNDIEIPRVRPNGKSAAEEGWKIFLMGFSLRGYSSLLKLNHNKLFDRSLLEVIRKMVGPRSEEPLIPVLRP